MAVKYVYDHGIGLTRMRKQEWTKSMRRKKWERNGECKNKKKKESVQNQKGIGSEGTYYNKKWKGR